MRHIFTAVRRRAGMVLGTAQFVLLLSPGVAIATLDGPDAPSPPSKNADPVSRILGIGIIGGIVLFVLVMWAKN